MPNIVRFVRQEFSVSRSHLLLSNSITVILCSDPKPSLVLLFRGFATKFIAYSKQLSSKYCLTLKDTVSSAVYCLYERFVKHKTALDQVLIAASFFCLEFAHDVGWDRETKGFIGNISRSRIEFAILGVADGTERRPESS